MIYEVRKLMENMVDEWAICGGDAIDLVVGKNTRLHKDIDIAVFWNDREQLIDNFLNNGWRIFEPDNGLLREILSSQDDLCTEDNLWCIKVNSNSYEIKNVYDNFYKITTERKHQDIMDFIELLFNKKEEDLFIYKRNPNINLSNAIHYTKEKIPYLAPEMVLLYKSIYVKFTESVENNDIEMVANYRHDFDVAIKYLSENQRNWLRNALNISFPNGHEWLDKL
ncbi:nucleotidyltransferase domain-containing protein [Clostridium sp.]|uniref:nucleotidyltransferase domain-containing protein n=1 Tax=Clostridium sp. TaxID=1506 RepID=UPI003F3C6B66